MPHNLGSNFLFKFLPLVHYNIWLCHFHKNTFLGADLITFAKKVQWISKLVSNKVAPMLPCPNFQANLNWLIVGFPTGRNFLVPRDNGTEVPSLSRDKGTTGQAKLFCPGTKGQRNVPSQNTSGYYWKRLSRIFQ